MVFINKRTFPDNRKRKLYISPKVKCICLEGEPLLAGSGTTADGPDIGELGGDAGFTPPGRGGRANLGIFSDDYYDDELGEY